MGRLTRSFTLSEFAAASHRPLSASEQELAAWWAEFILQPARDRFGPLVIPVPGGFVRSIPGRVGSHTNGERLDVVPRGVSVKTLADYFAARHLREHGGDGRLRQVIDERNHVHLAATLAPGSRAGYLKEPAEGEFKIASISPTGLPTSDYQTLLRGEYGPILAGAAALAILVLLVS